MAECTAETKAAAIADLLDGVQPAIVAERYRLRPGTVRQWKMRYVTPVTAVVTEEEPVTAPVTTPVRPTIEAERLAMRDLIEQSLRAKIYATWKIAEHATLHEWLQKQTAAELAELFTAIDRSAIDILDRLAKRAPGPPEPPALDAD